MDNIDLQMLKELSEADGISGCEKEVSRIVKKHFDNYADEVSYDNLGSIIGLKKGKQNGLKVMIAGHMDEVGFIVRDIDDKGYIKILPVGRWWGHVLPSQEMTITTSIGKKINGIVGSRAPHGMTASQKKSVMEPMDLFIDLGVETRKEAENLGIQIGDMITPNAKFKVMNNSNYLAGKAWDDRIGVAVAIDVLKGLQNVEHDANIYAVGTVQEEVGLRGARTATQVVKPDIAFALDVTMAKDTPQDKGGLNLGCGVILSILDATALAHRGLLKNLEEICEELQLNVNYDCMIAGGTDAGNIHKTFDGVVTMVLSIPTRYMHSPRLIIHRKDYIQTVKTIVEFCKRADLQLLNKIKRIDR
ncbi:M42 family metallopeptidase [Crassaminicella profunda]|uniref:M42 family metallopeptidase n=1 Tax=Crassaminicella profunda TaxID=1286698 RepID=UPI001CA638B1|nr:M42 family metallopeptidase [Crassaminicella profunda]QZY55804.1 M42 family metallopeptidase [Crassaminicella profunda]